MSQPRSASTPTIARSIPRFAPKPGSKPIWRAARDTSSSQTAPNRSLAYLNRLSVLPAYRQRGVGARLVRHIVEHARSASIKTISIGVIGEHTELQRWYRNLGFTDGETKRFPHLPFSVKYMAYALSNG